ncbi:CDP-alcohol phosphatidyltransferase family protein [Odoribacter sp. OttesenSCG-928-L07]|nr:CDP-alcohol phosphatidyltransferase family protein [Odoribacter sp. OttesenSCG-928-L07]MDL2239239.1 CDP-alcohol phosphatidyltransferase family protein [Bacteroidales bacterium OttesenSCG-928-L14]MDL2240047.1 CDP-alcohol phosphatidyltransferase family protein [Bacteroidales bacterium OttesenSCG-928-K22]
MKKIKNSIPNILTAMNLFCGVIGIIVALHFSMPKIACYIMFAAAAFDLFDGLAARLLNAQSKIGKELDSLSDIVSFGVLPAVLMFHLMSTIDATKMTSLLLFGGSDKYMLLLPLISVIFPIAVAFRLAKYNIEEQNVSVFSGLSCPIAAFFVVAIMLNSHTMPILQSINLIWAFVILGLILIVLSLLMVSKIKFLTFKFTSFSFKNNYLTYIFLLISLLLIIFLGLNNSLIWILFVYILISIIFAK